MSLSKYAKMPGDGGSLGTNCIPSKRSTARKSDIDRRPNIKESDSGRSIMMGRSIFGMCPATLLFMSITHEKTVEALRGQEQEKNLLKLEDFKIKKSLLVRDFVNGAKNPRQVDGGVVEREKDEDVVLKGTTIMSSFLNKLVPPSDGSSPSLPSPAELYALKTDSDEIWGPAHKEYLYPFLSEHPAEADQFDIGNNVKLLSGSPPPPKDKNKNNAANNVEVGSSSSAGPESVTWDDAVHRLKDNGHVFGSSPENALLRYRHLVPQ